MKEIPSFFEIICFKMWEYKSEEYKIEEYKVEEYKIEEYKMEEYKIQKGNNFVFLVNRVLNIFCSETSVENERRYYVSMILCMPPIHV
jgi:hypothetical protein